VDVMNLFL